MGGKSLKIKNCLARCQDNYSLRERRISYELLGYWQEKIKKGEFDKNCLIFEIPMEAFVDNMNGYKTKQQQIIRQTIVKLKDNGFTLEDGSRFNPIKYIEYIKSSYLVKVELDKLCLTYMDRSEKSGFYLYDLVKTCKFKSKRSSKLYEMMCQFSRNGFMVIKFDKLREIFNMNDNYTSSDIRGNILDPSLKEIQDLTDVNIKDVEYIKKRKKYDSIKIKFNIKKSIKLSKKQKEIDHKYENMSIGEALIAQWLDSHNVIYDSEYEVTINNHKRRFDFKVENYLIEFDGRQHFEESCFDQSLISIRRIDKLKEEWAIKNNFKLIRISFSELKNIPNILSNKGLFLSDKKLILIGKEYFNTFNFKDIMKDKSIHFIAKGIYAYILSQSNTNRIVDTSKKIMSVDLNLSEDIINKYITQLTNKEYITIIENINNGQFANNTYELN